MQRIWCSCKMCTFLSKNLASQFYRGICPAWRLAASSDCVEVSLLCSCSRPIGENSFCAFRPTVRHESSLWLLEIRSAMPFCFGHLIIPSSATLIHDSGFDCRQSVFVPTANTVDWQSLRTVAFVKISLWPHWLDSWTARNLENKNYSSENSIEIDVRNK